MIGVHLLFYFAFAPLVPLRVLSRTLVVANIVGALWSASGYVGAFGRAMNRIYSIPEGRPVASQKSRRGTGGLRSVN